MRISKTEYIEAMKVIPLHQYIKFYSKREKPIILKAPQKKYLNGLIKHEPPLTEYEIMQKFTNFSHLHLHHRRAKKLIANLDSVRLAKKNQQPVPLLDANFNDHDYAESIPYYAAFCRDMMVGFNINAQKYIENPVVTICMFVDKYDIYRNRIAGPGTVITQMLNVEDDIVQDEQQNHELFDPDFTLPSSIEEKIDTRLEEFEKEIESIKQQIEQEYNMQN